MLSILQKLASSILAPLVTWIVQALADWIKRYLERRRAQKEAEKSAEQVLKKSEAAKTPAEREDAARETIRNF